MSTVAHSRSFKWRGVVGLVVLLPVAAGVAFSTPVIGEGSPLDCLLDSCAWLFLVLYATLRVWATLYLAGARRDASKIAHPPASKPSEHSGSAPAPSERCTTPARNDPADMPR